jgi:acyl carrier protein
MRQEEFGISIPDDEAATVETVGYLVHIIDSKI